MSTTTPRTTPRTSTRTSARTRRTVPVLAVALTATATLGIGALVAPTSAGTSAGTAHPVVAKKKTATPFSFGAVGYGSRLKGGRVPTKSDSTAYQSLGCTNLAASTSAATPPTRTSKAWPWPGASAPARGPRPRTASPRATR